MAIDTLRDDLAAALRAALDPSVLVYSYPVETGAIPCVAIVPASPWWQPVRFKNSPLPGALVQIDLQLVMARTEVEQAFIDIEALAIAVASVINVSPKWRFRYLDQPEPVEVEGMAAMRAVMRIDTIA